MVINWIFCSNHVSIWIVHHQKVDQVIHFLFINFKLNGDNYHFFSVIKKKKIKFQSYNGSSMINWLVFCSDNNVIMVKWIFVIHKAPSDYLIHYNTVNHSDGLQTRTVRLKFIGKSNVFVDKNENFIKNKKSYTFFIAKLYSEWRTLSIRTYEIGMCR